MTTSSLDMLLVNPGTELAERGTWNREPPLGLLYIAAVLERDGYSCQILELSADERPFEEILAEIPIPRIIGFTCLTNTVKKTLVLAGRARLWYAANAGGKPVLVMGGPHVTFSFKEILVANMVDFCFIGETEGFISAFVEACEESPDVAGLKKRLLASGKSKFNIAFLDANGTLVVFNSDALFEKNLDAIPFPARHLYPINAPNHIYNTATVIVNRGCPNQCIFCSRQALFRKCRWRSPENVLAEIKAIHDAGTYEYYNLYDNLTVSREFMKDLLQSIIEDGGMTLPWGAELRADMIDESLANLLEKANCKCIATGIESANEGILKGAGKFQDITKVKKGLEQLKAHGIMVQAYFVIGLPGETRATFEETRVFIKNGPLEPGKDKIDFFAATPYPGSALYDRRVELGIEIVDFDFDHFDCQHVICKLPTISIADLQDVWQEAKRIERDFNAGRERALSI
nr:radical SAM protein [Candidatus Sigynarchaeota archaeon]